MFDRFWEGLTKGLSDRWSAQSLSAAFLFWFGGALAWVWRHHGYWGQGWQDLVDAVKAVDNPALYLALAVGGLLVLTASSLAAQWVQLPLLRLLEGYWPGPLEQIRFEVAQWRIEGLQKKEDRWQALADIPADRRTAAQQTEYARIDAELARVPVDPRRLMPTTLGNILRSAEEYSQVRYGLAAGVCWPRLWLVLPNETQNALSAARGQLDGAVRLFLWGALFVLWTFWAWWAIVAALAMVLIAYWAMLQAAGVYGDLLRSAFDLHRSKLYQAVRFPLPETPQDEVNQGQRLSEYLFRGTTVQEIRFVKT